MSESARDISQEYWRPAQQQNRVEYPVASVVPYCNLCGTQFAPGARFCHVCGESREPDFHPSAASRIAHVLDFKSVRQKLGLSLASLVMTSLAAICVLLALFTGLYYGANTLVEWQAVQTWRMEWMMAAMVLLLGAILFRDSSPASQK